MKIAATTRNPPGERGDARKEGSSVMDLLRLRGRGSGRGYYGDSPRIFARMFRQMAVRGTICVRKALSGCGAVGRVSLALKPSYECKPRKNVMTITDRWGVTCEEPMHSRTRGYESCAPFLSSLPSPSSPVASCSV